MRILVFLRIPLLVATELSALRTLLLSQNKLPQYFPKTVPTPYSRLQTTRNMPKIPERPTTRTLEPSRNRSISPWKSLFSPNRIRNPNPLTALFPVWHFRPATHRDKKKTHAHTKWLLWLRQILSCPQSPPHHIPAVPSAKTKFWHIKKKKEVFFLLCLGLTLILKVSKPHSCAARQHFV